MLLWVHFSCICNNIVLLQSECQRFVLFVCHNVLAIGIDILSRCTEPTIGLLCPAAPIKADLNAMERNLSSWFGRLDIKMAVHFKVVFVVIASPDLQVQCSFIGILSFIRNWPEPFIIKTILGEKKRTKQQCWRTHTCLFQSLLQSLVVKTVPYHFIQTGQWNKIESSEVNRCCSALSVECMKLKMRIPLCYCCHTCTALWFIAVLTVVLS